MKTSDIILTEENYDLSFSNGDFKVEDSDTQHIQILLDLSKGNLIQNPDVGVNLISFLNSNNSIQQLRRAISLQLEKDGYTNIQVDLDTENNIMVDAKRVK